LYELVDGLANSLLCICNGADSRLEFLGDLRLDVVNAALAGCRAVDIEVEKGDSTSRIGEGILTGSCEGRDTNHP
jgi:hypothetical protein